MTAQRPDKLTVLLVDDDRDILESVGQLFEFFLPEYLLLTVASPREAFDVLQGRHVDVIISDFRMPEMDGVEFLRRARHAWPAIPRFLFTAYPDDQLFERARREAYVRGVITKPCDAESFRGPLTGLLHVAAP